MNTPRPELHDQVPDVVARERDPRTGRITRLGNGDRRGKRDSNPRVSVRPAKQSKKVLVGAGIAIVVLLVAGVAVATTTGGESNDDASEQRTEESTLPGGSAAGAGGGGFPAFVAAAARIEQVGNSPRWNALPVRFDCTPAGCEPSVLGGAYGTGDLVMTQAGDRFVGEGEYPEGTGGFLCSVVTKADIRVLDWQEIQGIQVPARISVRVSKAVDGSGYRCDDYDVVWDGTSDVVVEHAIGG